MTITLRDGLGTPFTVASELNGGVWTPHSVPEVGGAAVTASNPLPVVATQSGGWSATLQLAGTAISSVNPLPVSSAGGVWTVLLNAALPAGNNAIGQVCPVAGTGTSRSVTTVAATSTQLFPANGARRQFWFQAPQGSGVWINRLGGSAGPNLADCTYWPAGSYYETGAVVTVSAITYYCPVAGLILSAGEI